MKLYLDIETLPTNDADIISGFAASVKAPGQYKKQDSIDAWLAENRDSAVKEMVSKTSFDGLYGRIACICYAFDDGDVFYCAEDDESAMLWKFYDHVAHHACGTTHDGPVDFELTVVGHNVAGFDLPFLKHRSIIHGIRPPSNIIKAMAAKPWDECIADTMLMWSSDRDKRVSMEKLCNAFGIQGKGDFDG